MKCVIDLANSSVMQMGCRTFLRTRSMPLKLTFTHPQIRMKFQKLQLQQTIIKKFLAMSLTPKQSHCVSADLKVSAGIARHFQRKFTTKYFDHSYTPLWPQWLPETRRYLYHLVTKQKYFNKPTYTTLRASLE